MTTQLQIAGTVETADASRYIRRLCKHFGHKIETSWDEHQGKINFAMGQCHLQAEKQCLKLQCQADNQADLDIVADCIRDHFNRFAVRDALILDWD